MKQFTVSIGIPAHNEEQNIVCLLTSLFEQKQTEYLLEKIYVVCDGCSDHTYEKTISLASKHPEIQVINDHQRKGKPARLNQLHKLNKSEILVILDADLLLGNDEVIDNLILPFKDENVCAVAGNNQPIPGKGFIEKVINNWYAFWYEVRKEVNGGNNVHNIHGCLLALRKHFAKEITYPKGIIAHAQYLYFATMRQKVGFSFAKNTDVYFYSPTTLKDYFLQCYRYGDEKEKNAAVFGDWIYNAYALPAKKKILALGKFFFIHPILTFSGLLLHFWTIIPRSRTYSLQREGLWKRVESTKRAIDPARFPAYT